MNEDDYIQESANPAPGALILACTSGDDCDDPHSRIALLRGDHCFDFGMSGDSLLSVDASPDGNACALGENGSLIWFDWRRPQNLAEFKSSRRLVENPAAEELGPLRQLRLVDGKALCAGTRGQVYLCWPDGKIEALPRLQIEGEESFIEDFWASAPNDLLAVTLEGWAAHFDGASWRALGLPVKEKFNAVCSIGDGRFAIASAGGTVLLGAGDQWNAAKRIDRERQYFGVAAQGGALYAAHSGGVDVLSDGKMKALASPCGEHEFAKLASGPDGVWACAGRSVLLLTPNGWTTWTAPQD